MENNPKLSEDGKYCLTAQLYQYGVKNKNGRVYMPGSVKVNVPDGAVMYGTNGTQPEEVFDISMKNVIGHMTDYRDTEEGFFVDIKLMPTLKATQTALEMLESGKYFFAPRGYGITHREADGTGRIDEVKLVSYDLTCDPSFNCKWDENGNQVIV